MVSSPTAMAPQDRDGALGWRKAFAVPLCFGRCLWVAWELTQALLGSSPRVERNSPSLRLRGAGLKRKARGSGGELGSERKFSFSHRVCSYLNLPPTTAEGKGAESFGRRPQGAEATPQAGLHHEAEPVRSRKARVGGRYRSARSSAPGPPPPGVGALLVAA